MFKKRTAKSPEIPTAEQVEKERSRLKKGNLFKRTLGSTITILIIVAAIAILISAMWLPVLQIYGTSMTPTYEKGEVVVLKKTSKLEAGDVIAFYYSNKILVKRVICGPGDLISIDKNGNVYINDKKVKEPYITEKSLGECDIEFPYKVPDEAYFVMGDNRKVSSDSRNSLIGCVREELIIGRVMFRVWPLNKLAWIW